MRLIDADHFSERFDMMCDAGGVLAPVTKAVREMVKKLIKAEPTVDAKLERHGRWEDYYVGDRQEEGVICTVCKELCKCEFDYCPNCGAKMDGDNNEN